MLPKPSSLILKPISPKDSSPPSVSQQQDQHSQGPRRRRGREYPGGHDQRGHDRNGHGRLARFWRLPQVHSGIPGFSTAALLYLSLFPSSPSLSLSLVSCTFCLTLFSLLCSPFSTCPCCPLLRLCRLSLPLCLSVRPSVRLSVHACVCMSVHAYASVYSTCIHVCIYLRMQPRLNQFLVLPIRLLAAGQQEAGYCVAVSCLTHNSPATVS